MPPGENQLTIFVLSATILIFILALVVISLLMFYRKNQIRHQENLQALHLDFDKSLLTTKMEIQEQTFLNISREIHDNINLSLTLVKLNLNTIDISSPHKIDLALESSREILSTTISNL